MKKPDYCFTLNIEIMFCELESPSDPGKYSEGKSLNFLC